MTKPPHIYCGPFSGEIYCATSYHTAKANPGLFIADRKYDVTAMVEAAMKERKKILQAKKRKAKRKTV